MKTIKLEQIDSGLEDIIYWRKGLEKQLEEHTNKREWMTGTGLQATNQALIMIEGLHERTVNINNSLEILKEQIEKKNQHNDINIHLKVSFVYYI